MNKAIGVLLLGHQKNVGKDTVADTIVDILGPDRAIKMGFADPVKDICFRMYKTYGLKPGYYYDHPDHYSEREELLPRIGKSPRDLWIGMGEYARTVDPYVWANMAADSARHYATGGKLVIFKDFRFPQETEPFISQGLEYRSIWIRSKRVGKADGPDRGLAGYRKWHHTFWNDGPIENLPDRIRAELLPLLGLERTT